MKRIIFMESFDRFPDSSSSQHTELEQLIDKYTLVPKGFESPAFTASIAYSSRTGHIGTLAVDGREYRGYVETTFASYGHIFLRYPKVAAGDRVRVWHGFRLSSNKFKLNASMASSPEITLPCNTISGDSGSYYVELCTDFTEKKVFCYRNKVFTGSVNMTQSELGNIAGGRSFAGIHAGRMDKNNSSPSTGEICTSDIYVALEKWDEKEEVPQMVPFGPVRVDFAPVTKVDADRFLTNNESKEVAVRYTGVFDKNKNNAPLFSDSDGSVGKFSFKPMSSTKTPIAVQLSCGIERGVSSSGKAVVDINDTTKKVEVMNAIPPFSSAASVSPMVTVLNSTFDNKPLSVEYANGLTVEIHSEEG